ncbi:site-2 protease family protein [uncultured Gemmiger sp.]|uniref:site-2 protease family protein n=1 Tax=uncultured Gemmiger sp. TaxID=1623490 RepID=UPI0025D30811|nr:site-2 protease family protein [uncultured Gemmiger sp.]
MHGLLGTEVLIAYLLRALVMLIVIPFHESAHALVSWLLGDPTAKNAGRLSLNPVRHFDLMGAVCMVIAGVGWAKPVSIRPDRFRNPKVGMAVSAAAGPVSNILLAFVSMMLYKLAYLLLGFSTPQLLADFLYYMIVMNISLGVFNLIPVPPFDGSRIFLTFLPQKYYFKVMQYERYIMIAVLLLAVFGVLNLPLSVADNAVMGWLDAATSFIW